MLIILVTKKMKVLPVIILLLSWMININGIQYSTSGPCQYCRYCTYCDECKHCPCTSISDDDLPYCEYCIYCKYCGYVIILIIICMNYNIII